MILFRLFGLPFLGDIIINVLHGYPKVSKKSLKYDPRYERNEHWQVAPTYNPVILVSHYQPYVSYGSDVAVTLVP